MLTTHAFLVALQRLANDSDGLTFLEILENVPVDPIALFTYLLLGVAIVAVYRGGRPRKPGSTEGSR